MEARILRPLGLARATYREPYSAALGRKLGLPAPMDATVAANITQQLGGEAPKWKEASPEWTTMIAPAGGMRASANDMAQYALALSDPARFEAAGVLKAATFAQMLQPGIALPGAARHGFMNYYFQGGRTGFGHGGAMAYGASDLIVVPDLKLGVFVSTNGRGGFAFANELVRRMLKDFAPLPELQPVRNDRKAAQALGGHWIVNRRPWGRSEAAFSFFVSGFTVTPEKDGDIVIGDMAGTALRFQPMGNGVWQSPTRYGRRIALPASDGTMTLWSGSGTGGAVPAGVWQRPLWMALLLVLTLGTATVVAVRGVWRFAKPEPASRFESYAQRSAAAAALFWAIGLGGVVTMLVKAMPDNGASLVFSYPGPMVALAWTIAVAVVLTLVALPGIAVLRQPGRWSRWHKTKHAALLILFALAAYGCWTIGLVGYSGF
jgi:Beta-lactamase